MISNSGDIQSTASGIDKPPILIASQAALAEMRAQIERMPAVAVDTESDSLYSYFEKVCLLQFSTPAEDYVVDPFPLGDLTRLGSLFTEPALEKVFHAAEYDIFCLRRDYGFSFENIFDTMIAARILGWQNVGLGSILQERFGVTLNKKMQRADWGHRPLSSEHIAYAREDTHYLLALRDIQLAELTRTGRLEEAREEFARLARVEPAVRRFDPDGYWNLEGARDLDPVQLGTLRELFRFRDAQARREDRPPFKILPESALLRIAEVLPDSVSALRHLDGLTPYTLQRYTQPILHAVERGRASPQVSPPRPHLRREPPLDNTARTRLGRLKEWRKRRATERGVAPDVIVSNDVLLAAARHNPHTLDALVDVSHLGPWKAREYGEELLEALHGKHHSKQ